MDLTNLPPLPDPDGDATADGADDGSAAALEQLAAPPDEATDAAARPLPADGDGGLAVEELPDGSAVAREPAAPLPSDPRFDENLAAVLPGQALSRLALDYLDLVEVDRKTREPRDRQYADGIRRTGLGNDAPGGASFDGASKAVHPMLAKGCVDFASRAIKELYPATGPVKTQIIGESTEKKLDQAERKRQYMNWQLMTQVGENRAEFERLLSQLPLGGSQYKRWWYDRELKRPRTETVYVDDVFLPYNQADFYTSPRVTHQQYVSQATFESRVRTGLYLDAGSNAPLSGTLDKTAAMEAAERVEGSEESFAAYDQDGLRRVYQLYVDLALEDDEFTGGACAPYVMHLDEHSHRVLGLYRNWAEGDELRLKKHWMVEYVFLPWRGAYGVGLAHLIGSLAGAATGALRALLDSAHINNFPGGLKLKGGRTAGQSIQVNATELAEIDTPPGVDDIRKLVMPFPFNGPSTVLFNLLEWLTQQAEIVVATSSEKIADNSQNLAMGTALALIEHGSVNFSAVHTRLHASLKRELEILHRLDAEHLSDQEVVADLGELVVSQRDFAGPMDIIPVSDPNIFSEAQRYAQLQAVLQLKADPTFAPFFKPDRLLQRALTLLQLPAPEDLASLPRDPRRAPAPLENFSVTSDEAWPLKVYEEQDDLAHLQVHLTFMTSPIFGSSQLLGPKALPPLLKHCGEHLMALYRKHMTAAVQSVEPALRAAGRVAGSVDQQAAHAAAFADKALATLLSPTIMPMLQRAQQAVGQLVPPPQPSPDVQATLQQRTQQAQLEAQAKAQEAALDRQANAQAAQLAARGEQATVASNERTAKLTADLDALRLHIDSTTGLMREQMATERATLTALLTKALAPRAPGEPDLSLPLEALIQDLLRRSRVEEPLLGQLGAVLAQRLREMSTLDALEQQAQVHALVQALQPAPQPPVPLGQPGAPAAPPAAAQQPQPHPMPAAGPTPAAGSAPPPGPGVPGPVHPPGG